MMCGNHLKELSCQARLEQAVIKLKNIRTTVLSRSHNYCTVLRNWSFSHFHVQIICLA